MQAGGCVCFPSCHQLVPACRELPPWEYKDYLGWQEQGDGKLAYGVFVQSGRVKVRLVLLGAPVPQGCACPEQANPATAWQRAPRCC